LRGRRHCLPLKLFCIGFVVHHMDEDRMNEQEQDLQWQSTFL
jgi:hypothetical protein